MNSYRTENYVKDKVIIVTGASSGFGKYTAMKAAELGGKVVLAARRDNLLKEICEDIRAKGGEASYIKTDLRDQRQVEDMAQFAIDTYGAIDILVNDAGTMPLGFLSQHKFAMQAWEECIDTSIKGTLYATAAVYDQMIKQGHGHVINVSSILGNYGVAGGAVYNLSKASVRIMADSMRVENSGKIKFSVIKPTSVADTGLVSTEVDYNASLSGVYGKLIDAFTGLGTPGRDDRENIHCFDFGPEVLADNIIYVMNQPWGVNISEITVRASGETMFV
ncbi:MAG TPA: SDR family oxidoreductase [Candidatus Scatomorpha gallistercoris]|nr:SDR family oxidoreductase [Candidatus Scatomorpha gallistercoris]